MHRQIVEARAQLIQRYVTNAPQCPAMWIARAMWTEPTRPPGCWACRWGGEVASRVLDRWAATGRLEGAAAEKAVPFPGRCPSILASLRSTHFTGIGRAEVGGIGVIRLKRGA